MSTDKTMKALRGEVDSRSTRGIFSRGHARYGVSNAPKPGNIKNIQKAARKRLKKMQGAR
jgi:hypothetical protein